jgi:dienelactone hydrolase
MPVNLRSLLKLCLAIGVLVALIPAASAGADPSDELPDPLDRGAFTVDRIDPLKLGLTTLQEPASGGGAPGTGGNSSITLQVRGVMFMPHDKPGKSPLIVLVHGNHGSCDSGSAPSCTVFKRNDEGYAYLAENLASWGYTVASLDQDQLISRQDGSFGKGMHARRLLIMAMLDALYKANEPGGLPVDADTNIGTTVEGKIDFTRIGLMGHSRGGDAVSSFIEYDRMRPSGRRYPLRGVIALAPVDYERRAPYGVPYMAIHGTCDGDVSNQQGERMFERSQYASDDPYPRINSAQVGTNHNYYNTVWFADEDDSSATDNACKMSAPNSIRLSGSAGTGASENYVKGGTDTVAGGADKLNPNINTRISGDPARMGDQEKIGLATMAAFFRRYVGGEGAMEPYLTGELNAEGKPEIPLSTCPTSTNGTRIPCAERVSNTFFAPPDERLDVIRPDTEHPLTMSALGSKMSGSGFANPYPATGGVEPQPATTPQGYDWCNPDPKQTEPTLLGGANPPPAAKPCPLPAVSALGGQSSSARERAPVNRSYGRQLAVAWDEPVQTTGEPATLSVPIPAADGDVSEYKDLALGAGVNFFDPRNPVRTGTDAEWNPTLAKQHFTIALTDADGNEATVDAGDPRYGTALEQTTGSTTPRVHVILKQVRVPLSDLEDQGLDLTAVRKLELRFGEAGMPQKGSAQLSDVRFQESIDGTDVLVDSTAPDAGPGEGLPTSGPNPEAELQAFDRAPSSLRLPDVTTQPGANVWTVDDDKAQCPNAEFTKAQDAIEFASPWDTIVICAGVYAEESTPLNSGPSPVQTGARNGLTISKPLKIKGAGASLVKIRPAAGLGSSLAGTAPYLRDGGGNVVTISRQSLGSSEFVENYVDISGVTIESPNAYVEAGISFFNTSGRITDSVVGPLKRAASKAELAAAPHGWGIVSSNSLLGEGSGTISRYLTVDHTLVHGYQSGGILFDDAKGTDGTAATTTPSAIKLSGYVSDSVVEGNGPSSLIPQTGIQFHAGAAGFIEGTKVAGNVFPTEQRKSAGVLLTGAETNGWYAKGSAITGNGYGLFNADVTNTTVREAAPALATENYWGAAGPPIEGPSLLGPGIEGVSGKDTASNPSVLFEPALGGTPALGGPRAITDAPPVAALVDPGDGEEVEAGEAVVPVVLAEDDFGVKSVSLSADGEPLATMSESPYAFEWTPNEEDEGETVTLEATVQDSSGQTVTSSVDVEVAKAPEPPVQGQPAKEPEGPVAPTEAPAATPPSDFWLGKVARDKQAGTASIEIDLSGAGKLELSGPGVRSQSSEAAAAGTVEVAIKASGKAKQALNRKGHVKVKLTFTFTASGGAPATKTDTVALIKTH